MPDLNFREKRPGLWLALLPVFLSLTLTMPAAASGGPTIWVAPPNHTDDTTNIQAALNACVTHGNNCTVQLAAGTYHTRQLVAYNFQGTFMGMGKDQTIIEAIYPLTVTGFAGPTLCLPNITDCLWPTLIMFVEGDIHVSDLAIHINAPPGTAVHPYSLLGSLTTSLLDGLRFMGKRPTHVTVDRISIEGLPDNSANSFGILFGFGVGFNVVNEIIYTGELPRSATPFDYYFLSGSLTVRNSSFKMAIDGVSQDGFLQSSHIVIGGSPSASNHFENVYVGMDMESSESSTFDISYNVSSGIYAGMWVTPWQPVFVPNSPSHYLIHDNKFITTGQYAEGFFFFQDDPANPWIHAAAWNNTIQLQDNLSEGIGAYNTKGTMLWNNSVTGTDGFDAVGLYSSTLDTVINNNVSGFTVDSTVGNAQIYLDPSTSHDLVVCAERSDTVLNQGTNNTIISCQEPTTTPAAATDSVAPAVSAPRPNLPKGKPRLF
jgi:hypothetical protein